jgi:hypothetical protein
MTPSTPDASDRGPSVRDDATEPDEPVPLRVGGPCPNCGAEIEDLDFLDLPAVAIKREMYDVCVLETDALPTPWRHRTAVAYHEDPDPFASSARAAPGDD